MPSDIIAFVSIAFGFLAGLLAITVAIWQNVLTRRALRAQSFLSLHELELTANYFHGMQAIYDLPDFTSYEDFLSGLSREQQIAIYQVVSFLDFVAVLIEDRYLIRQNAWDIYFWAYRVCAKKLLTWWLRGVRKEQQMLFSGFERMCLIVADVKDEEIAVFERRRYRQQLGRRRYRPYAHGEK
jgi:hypothetical protein